MKLSIEEMQEKVKGISDPDAINELDAREASEKKINKVNEKMKAVRLALEAVVKSINANIGNATKGQTTAMREAINGLSAIEKSLKKASKEKHERFKK